MATAYVEGFVCAFGVQSWCRESSLSIGEWAAWSQAVGSVCAIAAALWIVWWQLTSARNDRANEEIRRLRVLWSLVYHSRVEMTYAQELAAKNSEAFHVPNGLQHKVSALSKVPTLEYSDADVCEAIVTMVEAFSAFQDGIAPLPGGRRPERALAHSNAALDSFVFCERVIRRALIERGADIPHHVYRLNGVTYEPLNPAPST